MKSIKAEFPASFYVAKPYLKKKWRKANYYLYEQMVKLLPENITFVHELGCGVGYFARALRESGYDSSKYIGYDFSENMIAVAQQINPGMTFIIDNVYDFRHWACLVKTPGDVAFVCMEVLEHLEDDLSVVANIPENSYLLLSLPNFDSQSHLRYFKNEDEIVNRYSVYLDFIKIVPFVILPDMHIKIFHCLTKRKDM